MRYLIILAAFFMVASSQISLAGCAQTPRQARNIVALYDPQQQQDFRTGFIHRYAQMPLNHLGYRVIYLDTSNLAGMPTLPEGVAAIISWFRSPRSQTEAVLRWRLSVQDRCGKRPKNISLGQAASFYDTPAIRDSFLGQLGLRIRGPEIMVGHSQKITAQRPDLVGFETDFLVPFGAMPDLFLADVDQRALAIKPHDDAPVIDLISFGPQGGYAHHAALLSFDPEAGDAFWIMDPFAFFEQILGTEPRPIPDVTTAFGKRISFATIDHKGWLRLSTAQRFAQEPQLGAEAMIENFIAPFDDLPITVGVLYGDLDPVLGGNRAERAAHAFERLVGYRNVSVMTSGHDLVRDWTALGHISAGDLAPRASARTRGAIASDWARMLNRLYIEPDTQGSFRKYSRHDFDLVRELVGAVNSTRAHSDDQRQPVIFHFSDQAQPHFGVLAALANAGATGFGSGPGKPQAGLPVLSSLYPVSARLGAHLQVYQALPGDHDFQSDALLGPEGLRRLGHILDWSDTPRRLVPAHIALSAGSALDFAATKAAQSLLERVSGPKFIALPLSRYIAMAKAFEQVESEQIAPGLWVVDNIAGLATMRIDQASGLGLDLARSEHVLGAKHVDDRLYLSLDPQANSARIALSPMGRDQSMALEQGQIGLIESSFDLTRWQVGPCQIATNFEAARAGEIVLQLSGDHPVEVRINDRPAQSVETQEDQLRVVIGPVGPAKLSIVQACHQEG